jgi:hypothetical protein
MELGYPLPTPLFESRDWRGFCKKSLQNLERLGFRGQNLDNKAVSVILTGLSYTASALTIFCSSYMRRKVRCHKPAVEIFDDHQIPTRSPGFR